MPRGSKKNQPAYESKEETANAIERIQGHFKKANAARVAKKKHEESPAGLLKLSLKTLLSARAALTKAGEDLDRSITIIQAASTEFFPFEEAAQGGVDRGGKKQRPKKRA